MRRIYSTVIAEHLQQYEQMAFISGPRQVGKTTVSKTICDATPHCKYLNWDKIKDKEVILAGMDELIDGLPVEAIMEQKPLVVFDEIHKYKNWKNYLKGFIDEYKGKLNVIVTGSAKLNVLRCGGDSLMGRYFYYRMHPLSVAELKRVSVSKQEIQKPDYIGDEAFDILFQFGGFPEPYIKQEKRFYNRWQQLRQRQMFREDIRELAQIQELAQLEVLASLLKYQASHLVKYAELAKKVRISDSTIRRWINVLESFYYCFTIKPWSKNISRSLIKEPKIYLWDWSVIEDRGAKIENFVASHLLKAVHYWTDCGFGEYELYFLRDKDKCEVDFLVTKNSKPWILLEVKTSIKESISKHLYKFQNQVNAEHVFQLAFDMPYIEKDCFQLKDIKIVPVKTFLSQLI